MTWRTLRKQESQSGQNTPFEMLGLTSVVGTFITAFKIAKVAHALVITLIQAKEKDLDLERPIEIKLKEIKEENLNQFLNQEKLKNQTRLSIKHDLNQDLNQRTSKKDSS
ncbi:hypothetical protein DFH28DRAFT_927702 [Melampsora americana]|nr:hypothetical protein DFH28DRAFT_927702 [Melampsora americana]